MRMNWFDSYDVKARMIPAAIVVSPLVLTVAIGSVSLLDSVWKSAVIAGLAAVVAYPFGFLVVRSRGKRLEDVLWKVWDGPPSTRFARWRDQTFGPELKQKLHSAVENEIGFKLKTRSEEQMDPDRADRSISDAFKLVRAVLQQRDPNGLWLVHNAEYGFYRNLCASADIWLYLSLIGVLVSGEAWYQFQNAKWGISLSVDLLMVLLAAIGLNGTLRDGCKQAADRYADTAWSGFLTIARQKARNTEAIE